MMSKLSVCPNRVKVLKRLGTLHLSVVVMHCKPANDYISRIATVFSF
jgi:hypothetical protein